MAPSAPAPVWDPATAGTREFQAGEQWPQFWSTEAGITDHQRTVVARPEPAAGGVALPAAGTPMQPIDYDRLAEAMVRAQARQDAAKTPGDTAPATTDPNVSPDGHWRWDGSQWVPTGA